MNDDRTLEEIMEYLGARTDAEGHLVYDFDKCATRLDRKLPMFKQDVVAAMIKENTDISAIARLIGRSRVSVDKYIKTTNDVYQLFVDLRETLLDKIEVSQFAAAINGDFAAQRFILTTIGKHRGYTTQQVTQITGASEKPRAITLVGRSSNPNDSATVN